MPRDMLIVSYPRSAGGNVAPVTIRWGAKWQHAFSATNSSELAYVPMGYFDSSSCEAYVRVASATGIFRLHSWAGGYARTPVVCRSLLRPVG